MGLTGTPTSGGDVSHLVTGQHCLLELLLPLRCIPEDETWNQWEAGKAHHVWTHHVGVWDAHAS